MSEVVMLCGIPTSGKSTYVNKLKKIDYWKNAVVLSTDNYIEKIAEENNTTYNEIFEDVISQATKRLEFDLECAIRDGKDIIWDQTNLTANVRKKKLRKIPSNYYRGAVVFEVSLEDALERNNHRDNKFIPKSVLERMYQQFEIPTKMEGFEYVEFVKDDPVA